MGQRVGISIGVVLLSITTIAPVWAQDVPAPYKEVLTFLGKSGDFKDNVLKVNIPRNDRHGDGGQRRDADAVRIRRLDRDDQGHWEWT